MLSLHVMIFKYSNSKIDNFESNQFCSRFSFKNKNTFLKCLKTLNGSITYNPSAIHSNFKSSPLTSSVSVLTPEGIRREGLLWRIALAKEAQQRIRPYSKNLSCDAVSQRLHVCISIHTPAMCTHMFREEAQRKGVLRLKLLTYQFQDSCLFFLKWRWMRHTHTQKEITVNTRTAWKHHDKHHQNQIHNIKSRRCT